MKVNELQFLVKVIGINVIGKGEWEYGPGYDHAIMSLNRDKTGSVSAIMTELIILLSGL